MPIRRFPLRTLILMIVALLAFARLWWMTHRGATPRPPAVVPMLPVSLADAGVR